MNLTLQSYCVYFVIKETYLTFYYDYKDSNKSQTNPFI